MGWGGSRDFLAWDPTAPEPALGTPWIRWSWRQTASRATLGRAQPTRFSLEADITSPPAPLSLPFPTRLVRTASRPRLPWQMGTCPGPGLGDVPQQDPLLVCPSPRLPLAGRVLDPGIVCWITGLDLLGPAPQWWIPPMGSRG